MRISDWSSDVCSSDLKTRIRRTLGFEQNVRVPDFEGVASGDEESEAIKLAQLLDHRRQDDAAIVVIAELFGHTELHAGGVIAASAEIVAEAAVELFVKPGGRGRITAGRSEERRGGTKGDRTY